MMADLGIAEIRAEGRRLAEAIGPEAYDRYIDYLYDNADVLLADPAPVGLTERLAELEDWLLGAEHHAGCSGEYKKDDGTWAYRCKCGLRELRDERPVSPSVDPEVEP